MSEFKLDCFVSGKFLGVKTVQPRQGSNGKVKRIAVVSCPVIGGLTGECYPVELQLSNNLSPVSGISATPEKFVGQSFIFPIKIQTWEMNNMTGTNIYLNAEPLTVLDAE